MPRNVRNFWMDAHIDGRTTMLSGGPQAKDGGFELRIHVRNDGMVERDVLTVWGAADDNGTLRLHAGFRGRAADTYTTHRDRPIHEAGEPVRPYHRGQHRSQGNIAPCCAELDLEGPPSDGGDPKAYRYEDDDCQHEYASTDSVFCLLCDAERDDPEQVAP